jgi:hypothetical protein
MQQLELDCLLYPKVQKMGATRIFSMKLLPVFSNVFFQNEVLKTSTI